MLQETLCCKTLKMDHVMSVVVQTVNFIRACGLNHRLFDYLLSANYIPASLPYHIDVQRLCRGQAFLCITKGNCCVYVEKRPTCKFV